MWRKLRCCDSINPQGFSVHLDALPGLEFSCSGCGVIELKNSFLLQILHTETHNSFLARKHLRGSWNHCKRWKSIISKASSKCFTSIHFYLKAYSNQYIWRWDLKRAPFLNLKPTALQGDISQSWGTAAKIKTSQLPFEVADSIPTILPAVAGMFSKVGSAC